MSMKLMKAAAVAPLAAAAGLLVAVVPAGPASASSGCVTTGKLTTCTFTYTGGAQTWTVPAGVHSATFTLYGAEGGTGVGGTVNSIPVPAAVGGLGAQVTGTLAITPGTVLQVNVGQAGSGNGGASFGGGGSAGNGYGGSGGGASDVRGPAAGYSLTDRLLVAGGGGGGGDNDIAPPGIGVNNTPGGPGGNADSPGGTSPAVTLPGVTLGGGGGGGGGTLTAGGSAGAGGVITGTDTCAPDIAIGGPGAAGTFGFGADDVFFPGTTGPGGGGGGGGYYGGGSGGGPADDGCQNRPGWGGGGGGASYTGTATGASVTDGVLAPDDSPNGEVIVTFHKGK
jgi:hypothetical protein